MYGIVLTVELKRLVDRGAVNRRFHMPHDPEAILEADDGALIEAEQIAGLKTEVAVPEVAVEAVRQLEIRSVSRKPQSRRDRDDAIVRFCQLQRTVVVGSRRG